MLSSLQGSEQSKALFTLSADAGQYSGEIKEEYRVAESVATACADYAERVYWENTSNTYDELSRCLEGDIPDTTQISTTDEPDETTVNDN